ncbi:MAG: GvpL/GvpF family gas vesicle protein [Sedimentisphaerales bacterium]
MTGQTHLTYLYCVANKEPRLEEIKALSSDAHCICRNGLYAVAGKVEPEEFSEDGLKRNMNNLDWVKYMASTHEKTVERIAMQSDIIPFRFGTLFNTDDSLKAMLEQYEEEFKTILGRLADKQEWGLKIYCNPVQPKAGLFDHQVQILTMEEEIKRVPTGKAYFLKKRKETMIREAFDEKVDKWGQESFEALKELSAEAHLNRLLPKEVTEREDEMVFNAAFLVNKVRTDDFLNMARTLKARYESYGLLIDCTGPWPPYNFCGLSQTEKTG